MNLKRNRYLFSFIILIGLVIFLVYIIQGIFKFAPILDRVFEKHENLLNNQQLIDTIINLKNVDNKVPIDVSFKDSVTLYFFSTKSKSQYNEKIRKYFASEHNIYFISLDTESEIITFSNDFDEYITFYQIDNLSLPFRHSELIYPYKVEIHNYKIIKATIEF